MGATQAIRLCNSCLAWLDGVPAPLEALPLTARRGESQLSFYPQDKEGGGERQRKRDRQRAREREREEKDGERECERERMRE